MTTRRGFLASILAAGVAPAAVGSGILMPVRQIVVPWQEETVGGMVMLMHAELERTRRFQRMLEDALYDSPEMRAIQDQIMRTALGIDIGRPGADGSAIAARQGSTVKFVRWRP